MTHFKYDMTDSEDTIATKPELWRSISDAIGGFDLDPASGAESEPIAPNVYTKEDDGLSQSWHGKVWLNPPFSNKGDWYRKAVNEWNCGNADLIIALAPGDTSPQWYHNWFTQATLHCYLEGRDWYNAKNQPNFSTVVGVFGDPDPELLEVLDRKGQLFEPVDLHTQQTL